MFLAGDPDAARVHRRLLEQYAHLRDCPVFSGQQPYSAESRIAAHALAESFAYATNLPIETVEDNWGAVRDNIYPGAQEAISGSPLLILTE